MDDWNKSLACCTETNTNYYLFVLMFCFSGGFELATPKFKKKRQNNGK